MLARIDQDDPIVPDIRLQYYTEAGDHRDRHDLDLARNLGGLTMTLNILAPLLTLLAGGLTLAWLAHRARQKRRPTD